MTNRQQLNRLKSPYREQAFENVRISPLSDEVEIKGWLDGESTTLSDTLHEAFFLPMANEGDDYWIPVFNNPENYLQDDNI